MTENKGRRHSLPVTKTGALFARLLAAAVVALLAASGATVRGDRSASIATAARRHTLASEKSMPAQSASEKFAQLSDQFMKDSLAMSPTNASAAGYHKHIDPKTGKTIELDALLDDMSLGAFAKQRAFYAEWRQRFRTETPVASLAPEDAADWHLIDDQIGLSLLDLDHIQGYRHHPTVPVELIGNAIFLPLSQSYAPKDVRLGHVISRIGQIPRLLDQVKQYLSDADPIFVNTAIQENEGNIDLIQNTVAGEISPGSPLKAEYDRVAPAAIAALKNFNQWLADDLGKRKSRLTWRLGTDLYDQKFKLVMETSVTPAEVLSESRAGAQSRPRRNAPACSSLTHQNVSEPRGSLRSQLDASAKTASSAKSSKKSLKIIRNGTISNRRSRTISKASSNSFARKRLSLSARATI